MKIKISESRYIDANGLKIIALDDTWCIKVETGFEIDGKHKTFLQLTKEANLAAREIYGRYIELLQETYDTDKLDCLKAHLEEIDVIEEEDEAFLASDASLKTILLRTQEMLTNEFFNCLERCSKLEKENKPLHLLSEIGALRGLNYSLATCNVSLDEKTQKKYIKYIKMQDQLRAVSSK